MSRSLSIARLLAAVLALISSLSAFADASFPETIRLVRSMREDELLMEAVHVKSAQQLKKNKADKRAACLVNTKYPYLTDGIAWVISSQLSDAEVAEAIAFYRSPVGQKHVAQRFQPASSAAFTADEDAAFKRFSSRAVGRKLLKDRIAQQKTVMQKVDERLQLAVNDCSYENEPESADEPDGGIAVSYPKSCTTVPLASPNNQCSAQQEINVYTGPRAGTSTSVSVLCTTRGGGGTLVTYKGKVDGIVVKWLGDRVLQVAAPRGAVVEWMDRPSEFRVQLTEIPATTKATQCWPRPVGNEFNLVRMDASDAQLFWMAYGDADRCVLGKRMETPGQTGARGWVAQFRRVKSNELPFNTSQLVFFETYSRSVHTTSMRLRGAGTESLKLVPGGPVSGFHLIGAPAEELARKMAAGGEITLDVQPANGKAFSVPLTRTDFDWAHQNFASCLRST